MLFIHYQSRSFKAPVTKTGKVSFVIWFKIRQIIYPAVKERIMKKQQLKMQRNYKDTVFRMLFNNKEALLSLYNAINGTHYDKTDDLEIITLENAVYMAMKNDIAFILGLLYESV